MALKRLSANEASLLEGERHEKISDRYRGKSITTTSTTLLPGLTTIRMDKHGAIQNNAPFGGIKGSGFGVEFGEEGLFENTNVQTVFS
jgi:hypothetical protein